MHFTSTENIFYGFSDLCFKNKYFSFKQNKKVIEFNNLTNAVQFLIASIRFEIFFYFNKIKMFFYVF